MRIEATDEAGAGMQVFRYEAVTAEGELVRGQMEAPDRAAVVQRIQQAGRIPLRAEPGRFGGLQGRGGTRRISRRELALLTRELASLAHAGLTVDRALQVVIEASGNRRVRGLAASLQQAVRGGASLSEALGAHQATFGRFYVSMVRASEAGGSLGAGLARLADHEERSRALRESVVAALTYPAILIVVAASALLLLLAYVVPQLAPLYADAGRALPLSTRVVSAAAELVRSYWPLAAALLAGGVVAVRQHRCDGLLLRLPLVGELVKRVEMARLGRSLATLLAGGVSLTAALAVARDTVGNRVLSESLEMTLEAVKGGAALADALAATGHFPALGVQLVKVGEESSRLEDMLARVATIYDGEVAAATQRMVALLEPALVVGLGAIIGAVILSVLVAIVAVNDLPL